MSAVDCMPLGLAMRPACAAPAQADASDAADACTGAVSIAGVMATIDIGDDIPCASPSYSADPRRSNRKIRWPSQPREG